MNLLRKYKIHQITPVLNETECDVINFIETCISDMLEHSSNGSTIIRLYTLKNNIFIMELNFSNDKNHLYINKDSFFYRNIMKCNINGIADSSIVKYFYEKRFNITVDIYEHKYEESSIEFIKIKTT